VEFWKSYEKERKDIMNWGAPGQKNKDYSRSVLEDKTDDASCKSGGSKRFGVEQTPMELK
jgi:hypothetical protein